jgi:hypothetical protein
MTSTSPLTIIRNGSHESYIPKSLDEKEIFLGSTVKLGTPGKYDTWTFGTVVKVEDCDDKTGDLLCLDTGGNWHAVEPDRVTVDQAIPDGDICAMEVFRLDRIVKAEEAEMARILATELPKPVKKEEETAEDLSWMFADEKK